MLSQILLKIYSGGFYRQHAGMLLFVLLVLVGAVEPGQLIIYHYSLMLGIATSQSFVALICFIWFLYYMKIFFYILKEIDQPENTFLFYSATKFKTVQQYTSWLLVILTNAVPIVLYSLITAVVAFRNGGNSNGIIILGFNLICCGVMSNLALKYSNRLIAVKKTFSLPFALFKNKPIYSINVFHILNEAKISYLITKGLSYAFIVGIFILFKDVANDLRVAAIVVLAAGTSHAYLVLEIRKFEETYFKLFRNLPYTLFQRFGFTVITYLLLLIPESIWLFTRFNFFDFIPLVLFLISVPVLFHCFILIVRFDTELYLKSLFGAFISLYLMIMFGFLYAIAVMVIILSIVIFYKKYNKFE